jgi:phosphoglycolate phosphatase
MCLIGDTRFDAIGAKKCGIRCIGVTYGFGTAEELLANGAEAVFDTIEEVEAYLETYDRL